ncbi:MAG: GNAT family N-acetyltransferase [Paracoccaceae bacterium]|nr:GNAT family N-acetyltransferase [Paracoccaceae bacterium]
MQFPEVLETERLTLRRPRASDAGPISLYAGDKRVAEMLESVPHPYPPGAAEAFIATCLKPDAVEHVWVMDALKIDGPEFVGVIGVRRTDGVPRIGYWVGPPFWNTGQLQKFDAGYAATVSKTSVNRRCSNILPAATP